MNWGGPEFVLWIIGLSTAGWVATTWIRARHGYSLEDEWGGKTQPRVADEAATARAENAKLRDLLVRVEDRLAVLETIATDPGKRLTHQIDALRDQPETTK